MCCARCRQSSRRASAGTGRPVRRCLCVGTVPGDVPGAGRSRFMDAPRALHGTASGSGSAHRPTRPILRAAGGCRRRRRCGCTRASARRTMIELNRSASCRTTRPAARWSRPSSERTAARTSFATKNTGRRRHAAPGKFYFVGVREPLDTYLSLFNYGLDGRGEIFLRLNAAGTRRPLLSRHRRFCRVAAAHS